MAIIGGIWALIARRVRGKSAKLITSLDLTKDGLTTTLEAAQLQPPEVPAVWRPLMSLPRPREVHIPAKSLRDVALTAGLVLMTIFLLALDSRRHSAPWGTWRAFNSLDLWTVVCITSEMCAAFATIRQEMKGRALLRDGEVTIGFPTDIIPGGAGRTVVYQFWTRSGQRFEDSGPIESSALSDTGLVPVFYMPEDPTKNIALCCTKARVRLPQTSGLSVAPDESAAS
ncbi:MAG: hypothetical protein WA879_10220 [Candidatus Acidiferrales bacterium]